MKKDSLGDRMKCYENVNRNYLMKRTPVILRLDGRAFHTFTKKYCERPFDETFKNTMDNVAVALLNEIQGAKLCYHQSDELSVLITDYDNVNTESWFGYNIQKMCSIAASIASVSFNNFYNNYNRENICNTLKMDEFYSAHFDARVFNVPENDVCNYFIWRQKDWIRNSLQMYARSVYSHKELHGKKHEDLHELLHQKGLNWAEDLDEFWKNGTLISKHNYFKIVSDNPRTYEKVGWIFKSGIDDLFEYVCRTPIKRQEIY